MGSSSSLLQLQTQGRRGRAAGVWLHVSALSRQQNLAAKKPPSCNLPPRLAHSALPCQLCLCSDLLRPYPVFNLHFSCCGSSQVEHIQQQCVSGSPTPHTAMPYSQIHLSQLSGSVTYPSSNRQ